MSEANTIGYKICEGRKDHGLTLQQLAEKVKLSAAYLSQLENNKASPSIATLKKIATTLDMRIIDFFVDEIIDDPVLMEKDDWPKVSLPGWRADIKQMVKLVANKRMQPFYTTIQPGGGSRDSYFHQGEEFGLVLEGELKLTVGTETYHVAANQSFYYSSQLPHSWVNETNRICRVVWVVSPPSW